MSQRCPYCGEEKRAVKNHIRLASGEGHAPSGQYPDDFGERGDQDDGGGADPPDPSHGDGGSAVTVEAVEDTETSTEADTVDESDGEGEGIVAMPEEQLNSMLKTAASMKPESGDEAESSSTTEESSSTSVEVDPVEKVENADTEGWPLWKILLVLGVAVLLGLAWGAMKNAAESGREQASQFAHDFTPDSPEV